MTVEQINGGVCAPLGFTAAGIHCGIKPNNPKKDLALIYSRVPCKAAAVYTTNKVKGAPIAVTKDHIKNGHAQAVIVNSGNANTCNADGAEKAQEMCLLAANVLGIAADDVIVASTGVIGQPLPIEPIASHIKELAEALSADGSLGAAQAIMTTDTRVKEIAVEFEVDGTVCRLGGISKGSGMIHPNMATMLGFLTTDAAIKKSLLKEALSDAVNDTFNMVSVDGDTSTNDMVSILASGLADNKKICDRDSEGYQAFYAALMEVCTYLARIMAKDGEGATKLIECKVHGAISEEQATIVSKSVVMSSLTKAAVFGADANWGRILCAIGYAKVDVDVEKVDVAFQSKAGRILVCKDGAGVAFDEKLAKNILLEDEIVIDINLNSGTFAKTAYGCDLTYDYVKINGDYRT